MMLSSFSNSFCPHSWQSGLNLASSQSFLMWFSKFSYVNWVSHKLHLNNLAFSQFITMVFTLSLNPFVFEQSGHLLPPPTTVLSHHFCKQSLHYSLSHSLHCRGFLTTLKHIAQVNSASKGCYTAMSGVKTILALSCSRWVRIATILLCRYFSDTLTCRLPCASTIIIFNIINNLKLTTIILY